MTLAITTNRNDYIGNGSASTFSFTFPAFQTSDISVYVTDANYNQTALALTQDFTISGLPPSGALQSGVAPSTGSITLVNNSQAWLSSGNLATGYTLSIVRMVPYSQNTSIRNQGSFFPEIHENEFDDIVMMLQQLGLCALVLPPGTNPSNFSPTLPSNLPGNPNAPIVINSTGTGFSVGVGSSPLIAIPITVAQGGTGSAATLAGNRLLKSKSSPQSIIEAAAIAAGKALMSDANGIPIAVNASADMGTNKLTGLAAGTGNGDSVRFEQVITMLLTGLTPAAGAITSADSILTAINKLCAFRIVNIVPATTVTTFSTTSSTFQTSNLFASITPNSISNKILVIAMGTLGIAVANHSAFASIFNGSNNLMSATGGVETFAGTGAAGVFAPATLVWLDAPASVASQTYSVKIKNDDNASSARFGDSNTQFMLLIEIGVND